MIIDFEDTRKLCLESLLIYENEWDIDNAIKDKIYNILDNRDINVDCLKELGTLLYALASKLNYSDGAPQKGSLRGISHYIMALWALNTKKDESDVIQRLRVSKNNLERAIKAKNE